MLDKIDHLGIAVENLEEAGKVWRALGIEPSGTEEVAEQKVRVTMYPVGESRVELLESTDPDGPIGKFVAKKGQGLHHVAFKVHDIEAALASLKEQGFRLIDETPRIGAGGLKIAFVHPKSTTGLLVELCEGEHA